MLNSHFDNQQYHIKDIAKRVKQYLDHHTDDIQPQTALAMQQTIEHLIIGYVYVNALDRYLAGIDSENAFNAKLIDAINNLTQSDCLEWKV